MFERYSEKARRSIFFARYEASQFGSGEIETEHLLLGILREDRGLREQLGIANSEAFRKTVEERLPPSQERISTSVDLPLSQDSKRALAYAAEDAIKFGHLTIEPSHLVLGILHVEQCGAAELLRQNGIAYDIFREKVSKMPQREHRQSAPPPAVESEPELEPAPESEPEPPEPAAASLRLPVARLRALLTGAQPHLEAFSEADGNVLLKRKDWSRKQALGHLIDWATAYHQWIARALTEPKLTIPGYPLDQWVFAQPYATAAWKDLVELWTRLNRMLLHTLTDIPEEKLAISCRVGIEGPTSLLKLVERYVEQCEDITAQVLIRH